MAVVTIGDSLIPELKKYGVSDKIENCYNCGSCTASCALAEEEAQFPRKIIRLAQLGLKQQLLENPDPWSCYYCGDCSDTCPRGAEPAEIMMGIRRYQTAHYDFTGMGRRLYTSNRAVWTAIAIWAALPIILMLAVHTIGPSLFPDLNIAIITDEVALNRYAPVEIIWNVSHVYMVYLSVILLAGVYRMWNLSMVQGAKDLGIKFSDYVREFGQWVWDALTIKKWRDCETDTNIRWFNHMLLVIGYFGMFIIIVFFLNVFQVDEVLPFTNPQIWVGYLFTLFIVWSTGEAIFSRLFRKKEQLHKHSHHTDWLLPITVLSVAVTGILVSWLRIAGLPWPTYIMYVIHLMATAIMLSTEVGIGKWTHIFYRPLGLYFYRVKERAKNRLAVTV